MKDESARAILLRARYNWEHEIQWREKVPRGDRDTDHSMDEEVRIYRKCLGTIRRVLRAIEREDDKAQCPAYTGLDLPRIHLDAERGNDKTGDGSYLKPFKSFKKAHEASGQSPGPKRVMLWTHPKGGV